MILIAISALVVGFVVAALVWPRPKRKRKRKRSETPTPQGWPRVYPGALIYNEHVPGGHEWVSEDERRHRLAVQDAREQFARERQEHEDEYRRIFSEMDRG